MHLHLFILWWILSITISNTPYNYNCIVLMWFPLEMVVFDMHEVPHKSWRGKSALVTYAFKTF